MSDPNMIHWHRGSDDRGGSHMAPMQCCLSAFGLQQARQADAARRAQQAAEHAERVRVVTESLAAIAAYQDAAASVLVGAQLELLVTATTECAKAIRKVGCICPRLAVGTYGDPDRTVLGRDHRCGMHDPTTTTGGETHA